MDVKPLERHIETLITPTIEDMGFDLVRIKLTGPSEGQTLQIMAERIDGKDIEVEDCVSISRAVSAIMDVEDPIPSNYNLEVSSPGLDRPLTRLKDFDRFSGYDVKIKLDKDIDGQRRFKGCLTGIKDTDIILETDDGTQTFPFASISKAKLVLTDKLLESAKKQEVSC